jgi:hypothetical protein
MNAWDGTPIFWADVPIMADDFTMGVLGGKVALSIGNPDTTVHGTTLVSTGQWTHVAATRRRSTGEIQVLVNGALEAAMAAPNVNSLTAPASVVFGGNSYDQHYFVGQMDEVRIWNVVRTEAEIADAMHRRLTGTEPGLVLYWRLDEGGGRILVDASPAHNEGATNGSFAWVPSTAPVCP